MRDLPPHTQQPPLYDEHPVQADTMHVPEKELSVKERPAKAASRDDRPIRAGSKRKMEDRQDDAGQDVETQQGNQKKMRATDITLLKRAVGTIGTRLESMEKAMLARDEEHEKTVRELQQDHISQLKETVRVYKELSDTLRNNNTTEK